MKLKVIIPEAEEGGYWAEVPAIPGCATQGDSFEELLHNIYEAVEACLSVDIKAIKTSDKHKVFEIAVWNRSQVKNLPNYLNAKNGNWKA